MPQMNGLQQLLLMANQSQLNQTIPMNWYSFTSGNVTYRILYNCRGSQHNPNTITTIISIFITCSKSPNEMKSSVGQEEYKESNANHSCATIRGKIRTKVKLPKDIKVQLSIQIMQEVSTFAYLFLVLQQSDISRILSIARCPSTPETYGHLYVNEADDAKGNQILDKNERVTICLQLTIRKIHIATKRCCHIIYSLIISYGLYQTK